MHSVQAGLWDPRPPSKHASPFPQPPHPNLRSTDVTVAAPAKRITFYKSGDSQFGGIRMAVHKRRFKCFDTLLDDLSQKMPLPFGVRTVTTPRGTHTVQHLEQLQDGGCYLCSDRRQPKPINVELAGKRPNAWYHHSHRPRPPETPPGRSAPRQRRILLVRNGEPGTRRSVALSRRSARSLKTFLDEASEAMQFHVRKLYTAEGRRIDSVQSLMTCPGVLVCVGREAFSPTLVNVVRKSSEEKLPTLGSKSSGLGLRTPGNGARSPATQGARSPPRGSHSRASENSDGQESKKNVNFGLETKKSIIHPRSDSSNRSAHFSMSSEKSYGNSVGAYAQARPTITNEDIEKRVLVNKDGSLSLEMRVRFRLQNDETLQWSTQVKKSPSLTNESGSLNQPYYLQQGQSESCSDRDSASLDPDGVDYSSRPLRQVSEGNHCLCCPQRQDHQYDLWKNPVHSKRSPVPPPHTSSHARTITRHTHSSSSSSSCSSRRVVRLSSCGGGSVSERSRLVQEEMCVTEQVERRFEVERDGDTHVEVCRVSRCCSRSEASAVDGDPRPLSRKSVEDEPTMEEVGQRPLSAISSSSHVLQSLKEDQDDDLPFSATERCHGNKRNPSPTTEGNPNGKPTSVSTETKQEAERGSRAASAASSCRCKTATPHSTAGEERMDRASCGSGRAKIQTSEDDGAADDDEGEITRVTSVQTGLSAGSLQSRSSSVCPDCGGCKCGVDSAPSSRASQRSCRSHRASPKPATPLPNQDNVNTGGDGDNLSNDRCFSAISNVLEERASNVTATTAAEDQRAPRATSAASHGSNRSHRSGCNGIIGFSGEKDRRPSAVSAQSSRSRKSATPDIRTREEAEGDGALSSLSAKSGSSSKLIVMATSPAEEVDTGKADRPNSGLSAKSAKSNGSAKSSGSHRSAYSLCVNAAPPADEPVHKRTGQEDGIQAENRAGSATSAKSNVSAKSNKSHQSTKALERSSSPRSDTEDLEKRARSQTSDRSFKSNGASHTSKSPKNGQSVSPNANVTINTPVSVDEGGDDGAEMAASSASARSKKSNVSPASSRKSNRSGAAVVETDAGEKVVEDGAAGSECSQGQFQSPVQQLQRRESGGTEQPLSRRSSGSVSLWLPEDQETAESDSGKSNVSRHINSPRVRRASPENGNSAGSAMSQKSHNNGGKITLSPNPPAVHIPTIETPYRRSDEGDAVRAASALSARSSRSHKSSCKCGVKAEAAQTPETGSTTSDSSTEASNTDTPNDRASSAKSSASSKVRSKSPAAGSVQKPAKTKDAGNQIHSRASCTAKREGDDKGSSVRSKSPCCLKPESAASARSNPVKGQKVKSRGGVKTSKSEKDDTQLESSHSPRPHSRAETCSQSTLSHSLSAADLLKETMATERPRSRQSKASEVSGAARCEKSQRSRSRADQEEPDLTPACLPNISPSEVVSDWLRRIPTNSSVLGLGDEPREEAAAGGEHGGEAAKTEGSPEDGKVDEEENIEAEEEDEEEAACKGAGDSVEAPRPRTWCSSAALMKVLLGPSMGRCQSMPEVSPVYGRRLSTSARGFLDCLAQLQLLEPAVGPGCGPPKGGQYEDVMAILQSLWLTEPRDVEARKSKDVGGEQVTPPWSSSGVDMSSGSGGSGKENGNQAGGERERSKTNEAESLREDECGEKLDGEEEEGDAGVENKEVEEDQHTAPPSLDSPKGPENPSSSDKSSAQDGSKSPTDNERETPEDSSSGTPSTVLQAPLSKKSSQDPDPAWILQLLKKLEKQFMNHYSSAVAEFKVRWDLDDSLVLDAMIGELRDEVSRRVQGSVEREMRKIRGRAGGTGRSAQPPQGRNLSRESTMTEKRRQMLRVMKNQSVKTADSFSDGEMAGDFSDQRSDDEYCPCDACVRKKMAARPPKVNPLATEAPVMMEFDLLKILQLKKSPSSPSALPPPVEEGGDDVAIDKEARNLEVVQEEEEDETKEDIKADVVLEETIPEEDGEAEIEDGGEAGEVGNDEEPEEGGTEEETSDNVAEEEEEAQCHCQCAKNEEESDKETAKEAAVSEGEKSGEGGEEEEAEGGQVSESKPEDEEELMTGRECREEEATGEDNAAKHASRDEECTEGEDQDTGGAESQEEGGEREASGEERASPQEAEDSDADAGVVESAGVAGDGDEEVNGNKRHDGALLHQFTRTSVESQPGSLEDIDADSSRNPVNAIEVTKMAGGGGGGKRRSRSPARVKRRKPKACDEELDF